MYVNKDNSYTETKLFLVFNYFCAPFCVQRDLCSGMGTAAGNDALKYNLQS